MDLVYVLEIPPFNLLCDHGKSTERACSFPATSQLAHSFSAVGHPAALMWWFSSERLAQRHRNTLFLLVVSLFVLSVKGQPDNLGKSGSAYNTAPLSQKVFVTAHAHMKNS